MKTKILVASLTFGLNFISCKSQEAFSALDFLPSNTKDAEAKGFSKINLNSLRNFPIQNNSRTSSLYQDQKNDTIVRFVFEDEKLVTRAFLFPFKNFDSSELFASLSKLGDLIKHTETRDREPIGAFRKGNYVYYIFETPEAIMLINRPEKDKTTRPTGPIIEQRQTQ